MWQKALTGLVMLAILLVAAAYIILVRGEAERPAPEGIAAPVLKPISVPFTHRWAKGSTHPLLGAAAIDIDDDGRDEVFLGGSDGQPDVLLSWKDGKLEDVAGVVGLGDYQATYGALSLDMDADRDVDLLTAGHAGIVLWRNGGGRFAREVLDVAIPVDSLPMALTAADYDRDGDPDLYVSMFVAPQSFRSPVFNDPSHAKRNLLLRNDGDLKFTDVTDIETAGLQNTFTASFADLNQDGLPDLVLAQNTGRSEIIRNLGGGKFARTDFDCGYGFWMGLAFGDIDADGDLDIFLSNIGNSIPEALVTGDRRDDQRANNEWLVLRNDGDFRFTDITETVGASGFGFAWGGVFEDVNHDGTLDLLVAQNYVKWPVHNFFKLQGKLLLGAGDREPKFYTSDAAKNASTGHVPLIADLDGDGQNDIVWANMDAPARAYLNKTGGRFVSVRLPDTRQSIGARIKLDGVKAPVLTNISGEGLSSDRTTQFVIGLPKDAPAPTALVVEWADGTETRVEQPMLNETIVVERR
ncbi:MAG: VCBS repeat-containing protein [Hyphomicrobium sp.]|nr:VCBS repeat-containing protein [Hyphomicrobium sp.]